MQAVFILCYNLFHKEQNQLYACVILNYDCNEGYNGILWSVECQKEELLIPHALAVLPTKQGRGVGTKVVGEIITYARAQQKKAVRLDILGTNQAAEKLYKNVDFNLFRLKRCFMRIQVGQSISYMN